MDLGFLDGTLVLVVKLFYGCGLRITEEAGLRIWDVDYGFK